MKEKIEIKYGKVRKNPFRVAANYPRGSGVIAGPWYSAWHRRRPARSIFLCFVPDVIFFFFFLKWWALQQIPKSVKQGGHAKYERFQILDKSAQSAGLIRIWRKWGQERPRLEYGLVYRESPIANPSEQSVNSWRLLEKRGKRAIPISTRCQSWLMERVQSTYLVHVGVVVGCGNKNVSMSCKFREILSLGMAAASTRAKRGGRSVLLASMTWRSKSHKP